METELLSIARLAAGLFSGAAVYITLVEQPARMLSRSSAAIAQFRASLPRAERMQPPLLLLAIGAAGWAYGLAPGTALLFGILSLVLVLPLTFALLIPINRRLLGGNADDHIEYGMQLVGRWGKLHALRSGLAVCGAVLLHV